ncbi:hypothetical protein HOU41_gp039 [Proteus phage Stubb]|uniref:Uncharacterized protein n=1 Tax=Proteus phage Stubb TaxID=2315597 RepID=A0A3B8E0C5_9CAUD|nr:hypothetical protein HOU41_gp039 [Proteus phage Stubb]AYJ73179.1 hypothetical protein CPT_Stubb_039 [Proteus phage Stubb]
MYMYNKYLVYLSSSFHVRNLPLPYLISSLWLLFQYGKYLPRYLYPTPVHSN